MNSLKKIHIIGTSGTGKSTLARIISEKVGISIFELDDLHWHNENGPSGIERHTQERDTMLSQILQKEEWVIEGSYYKWVGQSFSEADLIIFLNPSIVVSYYRILKRYFLRHDGHDQNFKAAWDNVIWSMHYKRYKLPVIRNLLKEHEVKLIEFNRQTDINEFIKSL